MRPEICWIELPDRQRLAIMPRPRAGDWLSDEIAGWRSEGVDVVVSLLEAGEIVDLGLEREAELCGELGIEFISYPIPDRGVPDTFSSAADIVQTISERIDNRKSVAIHCRAGIGRSALLAACTLLHKGTNHETAFDLIRKARGVDVPDTEEQKDWVANFSLWSAPRQIATPKSPIWERIAAIGAAVPAEAWQDVPNDLSTQVDKFLYGGKDKS